jgi:hypothetical protein
MRPRFALCLCSLLVLGCAVAEAHKDQDKLRTALLDLYTDQLMDNLIRAKQRMPIIQVDYTNAQAMVTLTSTGSISDSQAVTNSTVQALPAKTLSFTRTILTTLSGTLGMTNANQITLAAVPLTTNDAVYDAYLEFLNLGDDSLCETPEPPPPGAAHICRKCSACYYWVPVQYRDAFLKLALVTTAQRDKSVVTQTDSYSVNGTVVGDIPSPSNPSKRRLLTIKLDKPIPNDSGYFLVSDSTTQYAFNNYAPPDPNNPGTFLTRPPNTTTLIFSISNDDGPVFKTSPFKLTVYLDHKQPKPPTTQDLLQGVNFQLQQVNQNLVRQQTGG